MSIISVPGPISGKGYRFQITGDTPTADEQLRIDQRISLKEQAFRADYESKYGELNYENGWEPAEQTGEFFKGIASGGVGMVESGLVGAAALLPEWMEDPTREYIKSTAYGWKPQADIGREDSVMGGLGSGLGSLIPIAAATYFTGGLGGVALTGGAGAGEASERARAAGATEDERTKAAALGIIPGALDYLPVASMVSRFGSPVVKGLKATLGRVLLQGGEEALQEAAQEAAQNLIAKEVYNPDQEIVEGVAGAAGMGGGVGALAQSLIELVLPGKSRGGGAPPPAPAATPAAPPKAPSDVLKLDSTLAATDEEPFDDEGLIPLTFMNIGQSIRPGTPEYDNLPDSRRPQEDAFAKAVDLGVVSQITKLAAQGKTAEKVAQALGRTINDLTAGMKTVAERTAARHEFTKQAFQRIGIPADPKSAEFARWKKQYDAFAQPVLKRPKMADLPVEAVEAAKAKKAAKVAGTKPTEATSEVAAPAPAPMTGLPPVPAAYQPSPEFTAALAAPATAPAPSLTPDFVTSTLGFAKGTALAKAAANDPELAGKPLSDPKVQARLNSLLSNTVVPAARKDAIRAAMAAPAPAAAPEAPAPAQMFAKLRESKAAPAPVAAPVAEEPMAEEPVAAPVPSPVAEEPVPSPVPSPVAAPYAPMTGAIPGMSGGLPGQPVQAPPRVVAGRAAALEAEGVDLPRVRTQPAAADAAPAAPTTRRLAVPTDETNIREQERILAADARARDTVSNRELGDQLAIKVRAGLTPKDVDFLGLDEAPSLRPDVTNAGDKRSVLKLLDRGGATTDEARAAKKFFSKFPNPTEALEEIGAQSVIGPAQVQRKGEDADPAADFYVGMGSNAAAKARKWVYDTLGKDARRALALARADAGRAAVKIYVQGKAGKDPVAIGRKAAEAMATAMNPVVAPENREVVLTGQREQIRAATAEAKLRASTALPEALTRPLPSVQPAGKAPRSPFMGWLDTQFSKVEIAEMGAEEKSALYEQFVLEKAQGYALTEDAATALDVPILPSVRRQIIKGQTQRVFESLAATTNSTGVARIARAISTKLGTTKIELISGLTNSDGDPVSGIFEPSTNTIYIDANSGMNFHTLLHEGTHAVVSETLDRPGHPLTQQLRSIFERAKPSLGAAYGTQNLQEFAAELLSNPEFQGRLAQLSVRGKKISVLDQAMHSLCNFVRRLMGLSHVPMETALTRGDQIIMGMMAPAPEFRHAGVLYSAQKKGVAAKIIANAINNAPVATQERLTQISNMVSDKAYDTSIGGASLMREALLRLTPLHYLAKIAEPYFPGMAERLNHIVNAASGEYSRVRDTMQALSASVGRWATANPTKIDTLNSLINNSTLHQVDPEFTAAEAMKKYGLDTERMDQWRMAKAEWDAVGPEGQAQYRQMRNTFKSLRADLLRVMDLRLEAAVPDAVVRKRLRDDLHEKILGKKDRTIEPYFPLSRKGDYWLSYNAMDPRTGNLEFFAEAFESPSERRRYIEELKADPAAGAANITEMAKKEAINFASAPPLSFMGNLHRKLTEQKVDPKVVRLISQVYLDTVPETSYLQAFRNRKGTLGFNKDALRMGTERAGNLAHTIVQLKYGVQLQALKSELSEHAKRLEGNGKYGPGVQQLKDQLDAFADFAANPNRHWAARAATTATFNLTLGFNISTALLNLMQTPMILLPTLGGRYGWRQSTRAIGAATRLMAGAPHTREIDVYRPDGTGTVKERVSAAPSLENYDFNDPSLPDDVKELRYLVEIGRDNGQFNRSIAYDTLGVDSMLPSESKVKATLNKAQAAAGWMLHQTERFNRETSMAATYKLELDRIRAKEGRALTESEMRDAAKHAIYITEMTNGGTAAAATPRIAHRGLGQVVFMYKRYGVSMYSLLFDTAKRSLVNADPADRAVAMKQLAGIAGMTGLLSGVAGLPMFGTIAMIYNLLFGDDDELSFEMATREMVGDGMYRGAINALLGINVASRIELSNLLFRESQIERDQSAIWTMAEALLGPALGTALNIERGLNKMAGGEIYDGFAALAPAPIRYGMKAVDYATEGVITRDGDKIVDDLHPGHIIAQALGFSSAEITMQQEINSARKRFEKAVVEARSDLTDRYAAALRENNRAELADVMTDIQSYNAEHPEYPVTRDTLEKSLASRASTDKRTFNGVSYNAKLLAPVMEFVSDYGE